MARTSSRETEESCVTRCEVVSTMSAPNWQMPVTRPSRGDIVSIAGFDREREAAEEVPRRDFGLGGVFLCLGIGAAVASLSQRMGAAEQRNKDAAMSAHLKAKGILHGIRMSSTNAPCVPSMRDVGSAAYRRLMRKVRPT